jgi:hypothetical protein
MRKVKPVAMIAAGTSTRSPIGRLFAFSEWLGPVKASSFRVASRIVNTLRAGRPVHDLSAFTPCRVILICVPDHSVEYAVGELERAGLDLVHRSVVLCDSSRDTSVLAPLAAQGAQVATVNLIGGLLVADGHRTTASEFRRDFLPRNTRILRLKPGAKPVFLAGLTVAGLPAYVAAGATACLREAGVSAGQARRIVQSLAEESLRAYTKGGKQSLEVRWDDTHWATIRMQLQALNGSSIDLAHFYKEILGTCRSLTGDRFPHWASSLPGLSAQLRPTEPQKTGRNHESQRDEPWESAANPALNGD